MDDNYQNYLELIENFYQSKNNFLTGQDKHLKCDGCDKNKIYVENNKEIILNCGGKGDCGKKIEIILPKYIYKDKEIRLLKKDLENAINLDIINKCIKVDKSFSNDNKDLLEQNNKQIHEIREKYYDIYRKHNVKNINDKYKDIIEKKSQCKAIIELLKDISISSEEKKTIRQEYIQHLSDINKLYEEIRENMDNVKEYFMDDEPIIKINKLDIIEEVKPKKQKKQKKKASLDDFEVGMTVEYKSKGEIFKATIYKIRPKKYDDKLQVVNENKEKPWVPLSKLKIIKPVEEPVEEVEEPVEEVADQGEEVEEPVEEVADQGEEVEEPVEEVEEPVEEVADQGEDTTIGVGSKVKWTDKKGNELKGIVEKITDKSYKICCKPGKKSGDKSSIYMVSIDDVSLD